MSITKASSQKNLPSLKNYFVKQDSKIYFPKASAYLKFPAGLFVVGDDRNVGFHLEMVNPNAKHVSHANEVDSDDNLLHELEMILSESDFPEQTIIPELYDEFISEHTTNTGFLSEGYFPMEQWNEGLSIVHESILKFLENKGFYDKNQLGYKRSVLLYGSPGTGKSRYIDNVSKYMIDAYEAVVIRITSTNDIRLLLSDGILKLNRFLKDRLIVFIVEEIAEYSYRTEIELLDLLDNSILRHNVMFLMTTNNPEKIPETLINRPSRVDVLEKVCLNVKEGFVDAWYKHCTGKDLPEDETTEYWYKAKLSPAYLKELFILSELNNIPPKQAWESVAKRRASVASAFKETREFIL